MALMKMFSLLLEWFCADFVLPALHKFGVLAADSPCGSFPPKENGASQRPPGRGSHPETGGWKILGIVKSGISKPLAPCSVFIGTAGEGSGSSRAVTIECGETASFGHGITSAPYCRASLVADHGFYAITVSKNGLTTGTPPSVAPCWKSSL